MFNTRTTFVIGAGASCEAGLPAGGTLATTIGNKMDVWWDGGGTRRGSGDVDLVAQVAQEFGCDLVKATKSAVRIRDGIVLSSSIDDFLDQHQADPLLLALGKTAIVKSIVESEKASLLALNNRQAINFTALEKTWFVKFGRMLTRQVKVADVDRIFEGLSFISFNYDRTLEHFLGQALIAAYGIEKDHADKLVATTRIIHPYGSIGTLSGSADSVPFGGAGSSTFDYPKLASRIQTYTESTASEVRDRIHASLSDARQLVFLGFGFHQQNMDLLTPPNLLDNKKILATVQGISESDQRVVEARILNLLQGEARTARALSGVPYRYDDCSCSELFERYRLSLPG